MSGLNVVQVASSDGFAGMERYVLTLSTALQGRGHRVTIVGGRKEPMVEALTGTGVTWRPGRSVLESLRSLQAARPPDVVHTHMTRGDLAGVIGTRWRRAPVVSTLHFAAPRGSSWPARAAGRWIEGRIARHLAISEFVAAASGISCEVVLSGVPDVPEKALHRQPQVLMAQRLELEKDSETAVRAWAASKGPQAGWRLLIAGHGSQEPALRALVGRLGLGDAVEILGQRSDVDQLMATASLFLAPAPGEPLGLSVLEAMAAGLPVIAARGGGHLETVGSVSADTLFEPGGVDDAASKLTALIEDPDLRHDLGSSLRDRQRAHFTLSRQVDQIESIYQETVR